MTETVDLLTADIRALDRAWDKMAERATAQAKSGRSRWDVALLAFRDEIVRQALASRRAVTEQEVAEAWNATMLSDHPEPSPWAGFRHVGNAARGMAFAARIAALSASPVDLDAVRRGKLAELMPRTAKKDGLNARAKYEPDERGTFHVQAWYDTREAAQEAYTVIASGRREYPAPAPDRVELSDGSVVTRNPFASRFAFTRSYPFGGVVRYRSENDWRVLADTGADFDALKAFAARVGGQP